VILAPLVRQVLIVTAIIVCMVTCLH